jgi:hypothetical protein
MNAFLARVDRVVEPRIADALAATVPSEVRLVRSVDRSSVMRFDRGYVGFVNALGRLIRSKKLGGESADSLYLVMMYWDFVKAWPIISHAFAKIDKLPRSSSRFISKFDDNFSCFEDVFN